MTRACLRVSRVLCVSLPFSVRAVRTDPPPAKTEMDPGFLLSWKANHARFGHRPDALLYLPSRLALSCFVPLPYPLRVGGLTCCPLKKKER